MTPVLYENIATTKGILSLFCWTLLQTYQRNAAAEFLFRRDAGVSKLAPCEGWGSKEQKLWSIFQRNFVPPLAEAAPRRVELRKALMRGWCRQVWAALGHSSNAFFMQKETWGASKEEEQLCTWFALIF